MKRILLLLSLIVFSSCNFQQDNSEENSENQQEISSELTTYYFIRHAEKDTLDSKNPDPELTPEGIDRSEQWTEVFKDVDFDLIYSSNYKRSVNTAKPIADSKNKEIEFFNTEKLNDKEFQENTKGKKVLVVGHSNLNPEFVNYIIEEDKYEDLDESVYGSLFIVHIHPDGSLTSEVLYIN